MRTTSSVCPSRYAIESYADGTCDIMLATNIVEQEVFDPEDESTERHTEYVYDLYRVHVPYSSTLSERIEANYDQWVEMAKSNALSDISTKKLREVNAACEEAISKGVSVDTTYGNEHFSLATHDQQNLSTIKMIIAGGAPGYPYHADGKACVMYSAADLDKIVSTATVYVTYQTTYCNMLREWIRRESDPNVIEGIYYGCDLPADLQQRMNELI